MRYGAREDEIWGERGREGVRNGVRGDEIWGERG